MERDHHRQGQLHSWWVCLKGIRLCFGQLFPPNRSVPARVAFTQWYSQLQIGKWFCKTTKNLGMMVGQSAFALHRLLLRAFGAAAIITRRANLWEVITVDNNRN